MIMTTTHGGYTSLQMTRQEHQGKKMAVSPLKVPAIDRGAARDKMAGSTSSKTPASDQDDGNDAARKRKRVSRACDACFTKKDRCDAAQPVCKVCKQLDRACTYDRPERKRGPAQGIRQRLEAQIEILESLLGYIDSTYPHVSHDLVTQKLQLQRGEASARAHAQQLDDLDTPSNGLQHGSPQPPLYLPPGDIFPGISKADLRDRWRHSDLAKCVAPCLGLELRQETTNARQASLGHAYAVKSEDDAGKAQQSNAELLEEQLAEARSAQIRFARQLSLRLATSSSSLGKANGADVVPSELAVEYVQNYFRNWHVYLPILDHKILQLDKQDLSSTQRTKTQRALLYAVCAAGRCSAVPLGITISPSPERLRSTQDEQAIRRLMLFAQDELKESEGDESSSSIDEIQQACIVLTLVDLWLGSLQCAWKTLGLAIRRAQQWPAEGSASITLVAICVLDAILSTYLGLQPRSACDDIDETSQRGQALSALTSLARTAVLDGGGEAQGDQLADTAGPGGSHLTSWAEQHLPEACVVLRATTSRPDEHEAALNSLLRDGETTQLACTYFALAHRMAVAKNLNGDTHPRALEAIVKRIDRRKVSTSPLCMLAFDTVKRGSHEAGPMRIAVPEMASASRQAGVPATAFETFVTAASWAVASQSPRSGVSSASSQVLQQGSIAEVASRVQSQSLGGEITDGSLALFYALGGPTAAMQAPGHTAPMSSSLAVAHRASMPQPALAREQGAAMMWQDEALRTSTTSSGDMHTSLQAFVESETSTAWSGQATQPYWTNGVPCCSSPASLQPYTQAQAIRHGPPWPQPFHNGEAYVGRIRPVLAQAGPSTSRVAYGCPDVPYVTTSVPQPYNMPVHARQERLSLDGVYADPTSMAALVSPSGVTTTDSIASTSHTTATHGAGSRGTLTSQLSTTTLDEAASTQAGNTSWRVPGPTTSSSFLALSAAQAYADVANTSANCSYDYASSTAQSQRDASRLP